MAGCEGGGGKEQHPPGKELASWWTTPSGRRGCGRTGGRWITDVLMGGDLGRGRCNGQWSWALISSARRRMSLGGGEEGPWTELSSAVCW